MAEKLYLYESIRRKIRPCDCLTWVADSWTQPVGKIIQWFAPNGYHKCEHIASVVTSPKYADRLMMIEAKGSTGVVPIAISKRLEESIGKASVYWHPLDPSVIHDDARIDMEKWLWKQCWKDYDFGNCGKQAIAYVSEDTRKLFCSELSGGAIRRSNCKMKPITPIQAESVKKFEKGYALRPWDVVALPVFLPYIKIL